MIAAAAAVAAIVCGSDSAFADDCELTTKVVELGCTTSNGLCADDVVVSFTRTTLVVKDRAGNNLYIEQFVEQ